MGIVLLGSISVIIIGVIISLIIIFIVLTYNKLTRLKNKVKDSFSYVDTQLKRRFDLIPNLVDTVKGYANFEKETLEKVTTNRTSYMSAQTSEKKLEINRDFILNMKNIFVNIEKYPDLKANINFLKFQQDLIDTENQITFARQFYNDSVTIYNNNLQMFPNNIIANVFGFKKERCFMAEDEARDAFRIKF